MSSKEKAEIDADLLGSTIEDLLKKIKEEENPGELNLYRKYFKKYTPFFMRSAVAAYVLRSLIQRNNGVRRRPDSTTTLFISIGKNRRVYPRDLVQLLSSAGKISKNDIGDIKILDNYSFVEVDEKTAASVITKLDGIAYRGRRLTVNYAKKRTADEGSVPYQESPSYRDREEDYEEPLEKDELEEDLDQEMLETADKR